MSKLHDRMRKILALAERGVGGEKENAQSMLTRMMEKYNVSLSDLEGDTVERYWWNYDSKYERLVLTQLASKVLDVNEVTYWKGDRKLGFEFTYAQWVEFDMMYTTLRRDLKEHLDLATRAFVQANRIFPETSSGEEQEYSKEELDRMARMLQMAQGVTPSKIHRQLEQRTNV